MTAELAEALAAMRLRQTLTLLDWMVENGSDSDAAARARDAVASAEQTIRALSGRTTA